jgi:DNA-binding beta-propeller fold protein YncE
MTRKMLAGLALAPLVVAGLLPLIVDGPVSAQGSAPAAGVPKFQADPSWPKLPNNWILGEVSSVAVDRRDHVWVLHRPRTVPAEQQNRAAPAVLEFDPSGNFVKSIGGPADGYEWADNEHGIFVDHKDHVWFGGNNPTTTSVSQRSDDMLLKFTIGGKFVSQFGRRSQSGGNTDTKNLKRPADVFVYAKTNEVFVADGYGNRRVIVLDADTGAFKRMWGAFSNTPLEAGPRPPTPAGPPATPREGPGPQQFGIVHSLEVSNDGVVYVADRDNSRIQLFSLDGKFQTQVFINRNEGATLTTAGLAFSPDREQQFMYVADQSNSHIHVVRRKTLEVVDTFGKRSAAPGDFQGLHHIATDSKGNLYTAEAQVGRRTQKLTYVGMK